MAELRNDGGALRLVLAIVARVEEPPRGDGGPRSPAALLVVAALEYLDRRDGEWWPIVRLPPAAVPAGSMRQLVDEQASFLAGGNEGYAWRPGDGAAIAVQVGRAPGGAVVEVGLDLGPFLADAGGAPAHRDAELALFRMQALQADLVRFSDGLARELRELEVPTR